MTTENTNDREPIADLPQEGVSREAADEVKGGATPSPSGPVPVPYPNLKPTARPPRTIVPCV